MPTPFNVLFAANHWPSRLCKKATALSKAGSTDGLMNVSFLGGMFWDGFENLLFPFLTCHGVLSFGDLWWFYCYNLWFKS